MSKGRNIRNPSLIPKTNVIAIIQNPIHVFRANLTAFKVVVPNEGLLMIIIFVNKGMSSKIGMIRKEPPR